MREASSSPFDVAIFTDKHPVQERAYAARAGLGWIGKNTCLINPGLGSWLLLGGVACSLDLAFDGLVADHCGSCTRCLEACPTGALVAPRELDARRCISYLTIELDGPIPEALRPAIGNHAYGCDVCQEVCPWNHAPATTMDPAWTAKRGRGSARADELYERSDDELHRFVEGSAMTYTTLSRFRRNLAVVIGNSGDPGGADALARPGHGVRNAARSATTDLVQAHVAWARRALGGAQDATAGH
jgi:epoxyqueuosine reductase